MTGPLDALLYLMNAAADFETDESRAQREAIEAENRQKKPADRRHVAHGFVQGSQAWEFAQTLKLPLVQQLNHEPGDSLDMFAEPLERRWNVQQDWWQLMPFRLAGEPPDDAYDNTDDEYGGALAWDADEVLFFCPRGICRLDRACWAEGHRRCQGC